MIMCPPPLQFSLLSSGMDPEQQCRSPACRITIKVASENTPQGRVVSLEHNVHEGEKTLALLLEGPGPS